MNKPFIADKDFRGIDYTENKLGKGEYENCVFNGCDFSDSDLSNNHFMECKFIDCNLSNANLKHTMFKEVLFRGCKMLGLKFSDCDSIFMSFNFEVCSLNLSSFFQLKLKNTNFKNCKLQEVDFVESDLTQVLFGDCDLKNAIFERTILEGADFRTSYNFSLDPELNSIRKAKFSKEGIVGLLDKYKIVVE